MIANDLSLALDPARFAESAGVVPDIWQADVLRSSSKRMLLNCSRQSGKSTVAAILAVHTAVYQTMSLVLLISPSLRQSQELFRRVLDIYRAAGRPVLPDAENKLTLELANGSRIVALPGKEETVRSFSGVRLLVIDEAARVDDDLYKSLRPMLGVSDGSLAALSTPFGTRGWWYEAWRSGEPWLRVEIPAAECPRISAAFLEEERRSLGSWWFEQEYMCRFMDATDAVFRRADIDAAFADDIAPLFAQPGGEAWVSTLTRLA